MPEVETRPCFLAPKRLQPQYPLFVFLPGMDGTGQLLRSQTAGLEIAFDVRCLAIPPDDFTDWDELTKQVLGLIEAELAKNRDRSVYLCGESFGGCLAMKVATAAPELFNRIILVNPASSLRRRSWLNQGSQLAHLVPSNLYSVGAFVLLPFIACLERILPSDRQELLKTMRSVPPETVLWRLSLIKKFNINRTQLRQLNQPVLLIASAFDLLLPSFTEAKRLLKILPNAQLVVLPYSGHACLLEEDINLYEIMQAENFLDHDPETIGSVTSFDH